MIFRPVDAREAQQSLEHARHALGGIEHVLQIAAAVRVQSSPQSSLSAWAKPSIVRSGARRSWAMV